MLKRHLFVDRKEKLPVLTSDFRSQVVVQGQYPTLFLDVEDALWTQL